MKKLSIIRDTYGIEKNPVITLNYHDGRENINYFPKDNKIDVELVNKIGEAVKNGFQIEYIDDPTVGDLK